MAQLALNGGNKVITRALGKAWPERDEREENALIEVVRSGIWWRGGYADAADSKIGQFEAAWARFQDARHCVALTNGTQAIECALKAAGIGAGDEVLVPALTFIASATAIAMVNAVPVFVDVDPETYNIDPEAMEAAIGERTRAAVVVHNGGYPCDMDRVMAVAQRHGLVVVEDCAHAHGTQWNGKGMGAIGDLGTFSFQMGKTLTCGEGGAVVTDDEELAERVFSFHHIGRLAGRGFYEFHRLASNLRMTEFQAAVLLAQLSRLEDQTETCERNAAFLADGLAAIDGLDPIARDPRVTRWGFYFWNFHFRHEQFEGVSRDTFLRAVQAEGVPLQVGAHGKPIYQNPVFRENHLDGGRAPIARPLPGEPIDYSRTFCPNAERVHRLQALSLPHAVFLGESTDDMELILEAFAKVRANMDELRRQEAAVA